MARHQPHRKPVLAILAAALLLAGCKPDTGPANETAAAATPAGTAATTALEAAAAAVTRASDPMDEVRAAMQKFTTVRSYHATMRHEGGERGPITNEVDFVAPDRFRMTMPGLSTQTIIGDTMFMSAQGRLIEMPLPAGTLTQWRDPVKLAEHSATMTVESQGTEPVDGKPARKFLTRAKGQPGESLLWIGADGYPLQIRSTGDSNGRQVSTLVRYSRFDDPSIRIDPPK